MTPRPKQSSRNLIIGTCLGLLLILAAGLMVSGLWVGVLFEVIRFVPAQLGLTKEVTDDHILYLDQGGTINASGLDATQHLIYFTSGRSAPKISIVALETAEPIRVYFYYTPTTTYRGPIGINATSKVLLAFDVPKKTDIVIEVGAFEKDQVKIEPNFNAYNSRVVLITSVLYLALFRPTYPGPIRAGIYHHLLRPGCERQRSDLAHDGPQRNIW